MAVLFGKARTTITEHINNVFKEGELNEEVACRNFRLTTQHGAMEGKTQEISVKHYNLDVIISVGYRVKSQRGTQFRIWATNIDYDPKAEISIAFFKKVQNKIHYAVHGQTAAEVIYTRADAEKEFMGLVTFSGSCPYLNNIVVAKNCLNEKELCSDFSIFDKKI